MHKFEFAVACKLIFREIASSSSLCGAHSSFSWHKSDSYSAMGDFCFPFQCCEKSIVIMKWTEGKVSHVRVVRLDGIGIPDQLLK